MQSSLRPIEGLVLDIFSWPSAEIAMTELL
jgi:hypothetical protein